MKRQLLHQAAIGGAISRSSSYGLLRSPSRGNPAYLRSELNLLLQDYSVEDIEQPTELTSLELELWKDFGMRPRKGYTASANELNFYIVELYGDFEWTYCVPITPENRLPADEEWMTWKHRSTTKSLRCYKYGITKKADISKRFPGYTTRVIYSRPCRLNVAFNAEKLFRNKLFLKFPKSAGSTWHGDRYHGRSQGIATSFGGATETFLFWRDERHLSELADEAIAALEGLYQAGGINALFRHKKALKVLEFTLLGVVEVKMELKGFEHKATPWASDSLVGTSRTAPKSGNIKEIHEWAIRRNMNWYQELIEESEEGQKEIEDYVECKVREIDLLSLASDPFLESLNATSMDPPLLFDFGMSSGEINKLKQWIQWCHVAVDYSPLIKSDLDPAPPQSPLPPLIPTRNPEALLPIWEAILSRISLQSTRLLLTQQAAMAALVSGPNHGLVLILKVIPEWGSLIESRRRLIEDAATAILGPVQLVIEAEPRIQWCHAAVDYSPLTKSDLDPAPPQSPLPPLLPTRNPEALLPIWEAILSRISLPSTRMLFKKEAAIAEMVPGSNGGLVLILMVTPIWGPFIESRRQLIEDAATEIMGPVQLVIEAEPR